MRDSHTVAHSISTTLAPRHRVRVCETGICLASQKIAGVELVCGDRTGSVLLLLVSAFGRSIENIQSTIFEQGGHSSIVCLQELAQLILVKIHLGRTW